MRKLFAIILFVPVMALFAESVAVASLCTKGAGADCAGLGKAPEKCMMAASHRECRGQVGACGQNCNKGQTGKSRKDSKDKGGCCVDCPICSLVTFKPFFMLELTQQIMIRDYTVMSDHNLSDYFQQHWKPPNGSLLSNI